MPHLLIYTPIVLWPVHFEIDLEIAQRHLDDGWKVTLLQCMRGLPACGQNPDHSWITCGKCMSRFKSGTAWLGNENVTVENFLFLTAEEQQFIDSLNEKTFSTIADVKSIMVEGADIGLAALGSVISLLRDPKPDVVFHRRLVVAHMQSAAMAFFSVRNHLLHQKTDKFVVFNGRFAELRGGLRAAQSLKVPTQVHERSGSLGKYSLTPDVSPHDLSMMKRMVETAYAESPLEETEKARIAHEWFEERRNNVSQSWYSLTTYQQRGHLPDLSPDRCNVVIFNSSEDEYEAFDEWQNRIYTDQSAGIRRIAEDLSKDDRFHLFIRVHPCLKKVVNSQTNKIAAIAAQFPKVTVIPAESTVSTYDLVDACDVVISFGTTVGIEAALAKKPVFLLAIALYEDLNCCVKPKSHEEFISILNSLVEGNTDSFPSEEEVGKGVVKFGFFNKMWGEEYKYVKPYDVDKSAMIRNGQETFLQAAKVYLIVAPYFGYVQGLVKRLSGRKQMYGPIKW